MKYFFRTAIVVVIFLIIRNPVQAQATRQDSLRGSLNSERSWWDVQSYQLNFSVDIPNKTISGTNTIIYKINGAAGTAMQIDLQQPMEITRITSVEPVLELPFRREGNVYHVDMSKLTGKAKPNPAVVVHFRGKPRVAVNAPWDGGWIFTKDEKGRPWVTVACQGLGASVWYPCKDYQGDEPDQGASLSISIPDTLVAVANGKQVLKPVKSNGMVTYNWKVKNPINNYNIVPYIGKYVSFSEEFNGEKGQLHCEFWVLDYDLQKATAQFGRDVKRMLTCFENWFGPYPFYEDNYKLVEAPHLGMEHQSAVAYGNKFKNGYLGSDISGSGWGRDWDYIIVHESGHEWFGNNITTADIADMWVHEGFTTYSEVLFTQCIHGLKAANEYAQGLQKSIANKTTIIGQYGINQEGSQDMYYKGASLIHMIRQLIDNDEKFRALLRGLNKEFYHSVVTSAQVEKYIIDKTGLDLSKLFDQYLRTTKIPVLEYRFEGSKLSFRWTNIIDGFSMPLRISVGSESQWIRPSAEWQSLNLTSETGERKLQADPNFYITTREVN
ncbi:MAG: M1 family metallopeptidase [Chitinophagaceae bacterium]